MFHMMSLKDYFDSQSPIALSCSDFIFLSIASASLLKKFRRDFTNIQERNALFGTLPSGAVETGPREKKLNSFSDERRRESVFKRHSEMPLTEVTERKESEVGAAQFK